jgi:hypothetical protein
MYIRTSEGLGERPLEYGLGGPGGCWPDAATKGTLCWFMSKHGGSKTAVYVPDAARAINPVRLLVWIHGDFSCGGEGPDASSYVQSKTFPLAQQLADSKQPFVLVAPSMNWDQSWIPKPQGKPISNKAFHMLGSPKTMNAFLDEVRTGLTRAGWSSVPSPGRLILAGHSRAHVVLNALAASVNDEEWKKGGLATLTDVWLLDATYGKNNKDAICNNWLKWAQVKGGGVNLRIFYIKDSDTAAVAECIRDRARAAGLSNVTVQGISSHCSLPRDHMPGLLAASVQAPLVLPRFRTVADEPSWIDTLRR